MFSTKPNCPHTSLKYLKKVALFSRKWVHSNDESLTKISPLELTIAVKNWANSCLWIFPMGWPDPSRMQMDELAEATCRGLGWFLSGLDEKLLDGTVSCAPSLLEINKEENIFYFRKFSSLCVRTYLI